MGTRTFTDIDAAFLPNPVTGDVSVRTDERAIAFAVKNLIMTANGERPFNSSIGSPINRLLFELAGDHMKIVMKQIIADTISNFEPRVALIDVIINDSVDNNLVYVTIQYRIRNTVQPLQVNLTLTRTR